MKKLLLLTVLMVASYSLSAQVVNPTKLNFDCTELSEPLLLVKTQLYGGSFLENEWKFTNPLSLPPGQIFTAVHIYYGDISYGLRLVITYKYKGIQKSSSVTVPRKMVNGQWRQPWDANIEFRYGSSGIEVSSSYTYLNY